jgi:hypothetical protein
MKRMSLALLAVLTLVWSSPARAAATELLYQAPAGCPGKPQFVEAVAAHGGDLGEGQAAGERVFVVSIARQGDAFSGGFQVRDSGGTTGKRQVGGRSCSEVADALAMVTAIALQAPAADPPAPVPVAPVAPVPVVQPVPPAPPRPEPDRLRGTTGVAAARTETVRVEAGELRFDLVRTVSVTAGATWGLVPSTVLPRYNLTFTSAHFVTTPEGNQRINGLVYQLNVDVLSQGTYRSPDTTTTISGLAFGISMCQSPHYDSRGLAVMLCVGYGGGLLQFATTEMNGGPSTAKNVGFGAVNAAADVQFNLSAHLFLTARLGGSLQIGDITAERPDRTLIFQSSHWSGFATAGVGFRF